MRGARTDFMAEYNALRHRCEDALVSLLLAHGNEMVLPADRRTGILYNDIYGQKRCMIERIELFPFKTADGTERYDLRFHGDGMFFQVTQLSLSELSRFYNICFDLLN